MTQNLFQTYPRYEEFFDYFVETYLGTTGVGNMVPNNAAANAAPNNMAGNVAPNNAAPINVTPMPNVGPNNEAPNVVAPNPIKPKK